MVEGQEVKRYKNIDLTDMLKEVEMLGFHFNVPEDGKITFETRPAITVSPDGGRGAYGWCSINEIWNASGEKYREINLCAEYPDRPIFELAATLLHEMAHLYNHGWTVTTLAPEAWVRETTGEAGINASRL